MKKASISSIRRLFAVAAISAATMGIFSLKAQAQTTEIPESTHKKTEDVTASTMPASPGDTTQTAADSSRYKLSARFNNPRDFFVQYGRRDVSGPLGDRTGNALRLGMLNVSLGSSLNNMGFSFLSSRDNTPYPESFSLVGMQGQLGGENFYLSPFAGLKAEVDSLRFAWGFTGGITVGDPRKIQVSFASGFLRQGSEKDKNYQEFVATGLEITRRLSSNGLQVTAGINGQINQNPTIPTLDHRRFVYKYFGEVQSPAFIKKPIEVSGIFNAYVRSLQERTSEDKITLTQVPGFSFGGLVSLKQPSVQPTFKKKSVKKLLYENKLGLSFGLDATGKMTLNVEARRTLQSSSGNRR